MSVLTWDQEGQKLFETGVDHGVLYVKGASGYENGVAWNGLTAVNEAPSGAETTALWADNIKYLNLMSVEDFKATIEAYTYPDEFAECDGSVNVATGVSIGQQRRKTFGLSYRTLIGNDVDDIDHGYKIHLVYGCLAAPTDRNNATRNDTPDAMTFSWEIQTTPVEISAKDANDKPYKPTAHLVIDSTKFNTTALQTKLETIKDLIYGTSSTEPTLPTPDQIITIMTTNG